MRTKRTAACSLSVALVTWTGPIAKRSPAPGWQAPQVFARFAGCTVERGSLDGRMLWTPWQDAQLATLCEPARPARP